jgi:Cu(I)/Ag(I) efflux system membrane fusion protein
MRTFRNTKLATVFALLAVVAFGAGYLARGNAPSQPPAAHDQPGEHDLAAHVDDAGKITWTCSMHPQIQLPEPGKCPICFMDLIPLERRDEGTRTSLREISLTEDARRLAGIETEAVRRLDVAVETRMTGKVEYDETRVRNITAWAGGRVDTMYVDYTGDTVKKGQAMVSVYSPELLTAQAELIQAVRAVRDLEGSNLPLVKDSASRTEQAAREKLRLLGLTRAQIDAVAREGKPSDHIVLYAPQGGVVIGKDVNEGQYVKTGANLYSIADLSSLWVVLEAYESDLPWVDLGQEVEFTTEAYPGKPFSGKVVYIDPVVNEKTRTVRVRLSVPNRDGSLKPGMLVRATQSKGGPQAKGKTPDGEPPLVIPATAPLITGKRAVVYVADPDKDGAYEGREIVLGARAGDYYIVKNGLKEGDLVVTKGNFKIDSAVQIVARPSMMNPAPPPSPVTGELPPLFLSRLRLLNTDFAALTAEMATADLAKTHLAFGRFNKALRLIDGSDLSGDPAMDWRELSMLLGNDAILGAEARDADRLQDIFAEMQTHFADLRRAFDLSEPVAGRTVPDRFRRELGAVFAAYEPLAGALAVDDLGRAKAAADTVAEALRGVHADGLDGPSHNDWTAAINKMTDGLDAIRQAGDLVGVRTGFEPLSVGLAEAILALGADTGSSLYEIFCPMAFEYKGATWLQRDETVRNPYFGPAMSSCGEVNRQLAQ